MKRVMMVLALVGTAAGVAGAQLPQSPAGPSAAIRTSAIRTSAPAEPLAQARPTPILTARQAPVPMMLHRRPPAFVPASGTARGQEAGQEPGQGPVAGTTSVEAALRGLTEGDARTAIEADGYKKVRAMNKTADGSWRARALRGTTEVALRVDATGSVSAD